MAAKRKATSLAPEDEEPIDPSDELLFLCLGGGNEVGRSCHIIQYKGKTVMVRLLEALQGGIFVLTTNSLMLVCTLRMRASLPCRSMMNSISAQSMCS